MAVITSRTLAWTLMILGLSRRKATGELLMSFTRPELANAVGTRRPTMRAVYRSASETFHAVPLA